MFWGHPMFNFQKCHPIELNDLVRIGNKNDGGYVLSKRIIDNTKIILSFGIDSDWSFEKDFSQRKNIKIYAYDYSTKNLPFVTKKFTKTYAHIVYNLLHRNFSSVKKHIREFGLSKDFHRFFNTGKAIFIPKYLGQYDDEINICFETIFKELGTVDDLSIFIKMDIELNEYYCLPQLIPYFDKINGMVVEFHKLGITDAKFEELLDTFSSCFHIVHTHGNNAGKLIFKTNIPEILEITFINKKLITGQIALSKQNYPIYGLDAPNIKNKDDYKLTFQ